MSPHISLETAMHRAPPLYIWCLTLLASLGVAAPQVAVAKDTPKPVGRVSVTLGNVTADGAHGQRKLGVASPVFNGDRVSTAANQSTAATLLLDTRVVVNLDAGTAVRVVEHRGKTELQLERG